MDNPFLEQIKSKYRLGQFVQGKVEYHAPFGIFVDLGEATVKGLIKIPDFLDEGIMSAEMYPEIGTTVGADIVLLSVAIAIHRLPNLSTWFRRLC